MATNRTGQVIQHLRKAALLQEAGGLTDGHLLGCFIDHRDEAAFAAILKRHGPMVWGVCRRLLPHHDAEDAFQATFLVLVRKAASVLPREMVANWLYGVAHQVALHSRRTTARRRSRERQVTPMPEPGGAEQEPWHDLLPLLDQELARLPDKYRVAIVLCDLEGKTRKDAARQLGCPEGTLAARLARGRVQLAKRLARQGLILSGGAVAAVLSRQAVSASVPPSAASSTIKAATVIAAGQAAAGVISVKVASLTEGVLRTMLLNKLKRVVVLVVVIALLGSGGGAFVWQSRAGDQPARQAGTGQAVRGNDDDFKRRLLDLDELWWKGGVDTLRRLAADDLITVSGVGRYDKPSLLGAAKNRHPTDWTKRDIEVSRVSRDVAIVTYVYDCKVVLNDGTLVQNRRDRRFSMTWVNRKSGWVVVFAQETILPGGE
jgi:RNA polymerase sigma factor (sigma-70 family)